MDYESILKLLKLDLRISVSAYDTLLQAYIESAEKAIEIEGINLMPGDEADEMLVVQYAAWLFRHREDNIPMSRMLRWQLNNRLLSEKARD